MNMTGSTDSMEFFPLKQQNERSSINLHCWPDKICFSNIWIPSNLLLERQKTRDDPAYRATYNRLQKTDQIESFSVYTEINNEKDLQDLYSNNHKKTEKHTKDIDCELNNEFSSIGILNKYDLGGIINSNLKTVPSVDNLALIDEVAQENVLYQANFQTSILKSKKTDSLNEFPSTHKTKLQSKQKKNKKQKTKGSLTLDAFLDGYEEEDLQEACCNDYLKKILAEKDKKDDISLKSTVAFPTLEPLEFKFGHSTGKKVNLEQNVFEAQSKSNEIKEIKMTNIAKEELSPATSDFIGETFLSTPTTDFAEEMAPPTPPEKIIAKLIIENIPKGVSKEEVYYLFDSYEIKNVYLKPDGEFSKAYAEVELVPEKVDWIMDCLNETEPFGASSKKLKCYRQL